jgi:beta-lactamase class A
LGKQTNFHENGIKVLSKKIPLSYALVCILLFSGIAYFVATRIADNKDKKQAAIATSATSIAPECVYGITRLSGFRHIGPIVTAAQECEAEPLMPLKISIANYIENQQLSGNLITASVYLRRLNDDSWMNINPNEVFHPASLLKLPQLITYLKKAETEPGLLSKEFLFEGAQGDMPTQYYSAKTLQPGHKYSIKELFHFMIVYSDNNANIELVKRMDMDMFNNTFKALRMVPPDLSDYNYQVSTRDYSKFLELLYNASYLSISASEYATELLAEAAFKDGILKKIPKTVGVAHKMGEWGDGNTVELHDCGIVYVENNPYIITVMTRGTDMEKLSEAIGNISEITYNAMLAPGFCKKPLAQQ